MNQGQSLSTIDKERQIGAMFAQQRAILLAKPSILANRPYYHIDLNAGSGLNSDFHVPGSPFVFITIMHDIPYRACFIDHDSEAIANLQSRMRCIDRTNIHVFCEDNRDALLRLATIIPPYAIGSVLSDPNGWAYRNGKGEGIPVPELQKFADSHPRMDLMMNLNLRSFVTMDGYHQNHPNVEYPDLYSIDEFPQVFRRQYWTIGRSNNGRNGFARLIGRNMPTGDWPKMGLYSTNSARGLKILHDLRTPKLLRETGQQQLLFGKIS